MSYSDRVNPRKLAADRKKVVAQQNAYREEREQVQMTSEEHATFHRTVGLRCDQPGCNLSQAVQSLFGEIRTAAEGEAAYDVLTILDRKDL